MARRVLGKVIGLRLDGTDAREHALVRPSTSIGRAPECDITVSNPLFSRKHCLIEIDEDEDMRLVNCSKVNQTCINGVPITGECVLANGDVITLADRHIRFEYPPTHSAAKKMCLPQGEPTAPPVIVVSSSDASDASYVFLPAAPSNAAASSTVTRTRQQHRQAQPGAGPSGAAANPVVEVNDDDDEYVYEVDPDQNAPSAGPSGHTLPFELQEHSDPPYDESDSDEDNEHINQWRDGDLGTLALAINFYRDELKGRFVGTSGGAERKRLAWQKVADYVNSRCHTLWTVPQCKTKVSKYCLVVKEKIQRNRVARNQTGGGELDDALELTQTDEIFMDWVGVEGVVGVPGIHGVSLEPDCDQSYLDDRQRRIFREWDYKREDKPTYKELPGGFIKLPKKTPAKRPPRRR